MQGPASVSDPCTLTEVIVILAVYARAASNASILYISDLTETSFKLFTIQWAKNRRLSC